jgi:hypothetical protein
MNILFIILYWFIGFYSAKITSNNNDEGFKAHPSTHKDIPLVFWVLLGCACVVVVIGMASLLSEA